MSITTELIMVSGIVMVSVNISSDLGTSMKILEEDGISMWLVTLMTQRRVLELDQLE